VTGRADDVVISGGVKVPTPAVEQMLLEHPSVDEVAVFGIPDDEWGEIVVAVVASRDGAVTLEELRDLVSPREWGPRRMFAAFSLVRLPNGKPDLVGMRHWVTHA
jgi:O-succinylbenzoic acid--CoA ligase